MLLITSCRSNVAVQIVPRTCSGRRYRKRRSKTEPRETAGGNDIENLKGNAGPVTRNSLFRDKSYRALKVYLARRYSSIHRPSPQINSLRGIFLHKVNLT